MKERPILFNAEMVGALLDGRKTQTRRLVKNQPAGDTPGSDCRAAKVAGGFQWQHRGGASTVFDCPYGKPGDRLWVRETTEADEETADLAVLARYSADGSPVLYSGCDDPEYDGSVAHWDYSRPTRPSIHMPRWACRLLLEITTVRVERLQDISETDAQAEGVNGEAEAAAAGLPWHDNPRRAFRFLWKRINGPDSWDANPWVWVVEFKRIDSSEVA